MLEAILRSLPQGRSEVDPADTLEIVRLIEAANESRATGRSVSLYVERHNAASCLYERLGFRPVVDDGVYLRLEWRRTMSAELTIPDAAHTTHAASARKASNRVAGTAGA